MCCSAAVPPFADHGRRPFPFRRTGTGGAQRVPGLGHRARLVPCSHLNEAAPVALLHGLDRPSKLNQDRRHDIPKQKHKVTNSGAYDDLTAVSTTLSPSQGQQHPRHAPSSATYHGQRRQ